MREFSDNLFGPGSPIKVIGHRGAAAFAPENTLPAFRHAVEVGADAVELDLKATRCGRLVAFHDETLERTTDGAGEVESFTLEELQQLDAGFHFSPDNGRSFPYRGQGVVIPTLEEVLETIGQMPIIIEVKSARSGVALGNWLTDSPERDRILVGGFKRSLVDPAGRRARWRAAYEDEVRAYVLLGKIGLSALVRPVVQALIIPERRGMFRILSPGFVRRVHGDGLGLFVWTVNEADDMRRLTGWGVDGLVTDVPGRARRVLDEIGAAGPST